MARKHIIYFSGHEFACDSITAATQIVAALSKLRPAKHVTEGHYDDWHYAPDDRDFKQPDVSLKLNQEFREPRKPKSEKSLHLPAPKRGSILCLCERSYVAPKQNCPSCGLAFNVSHGRTHEQAEQTANQAKLRLIP